MWICHFENEIGETDIDVKVLQEGERSLNVYEMTENCVCCTGKADFLTNLMTILSALDPEVLIVEPTGAARLSILMAAIEGLFYDAIDLLPPITIVDATTFFMERTASVIFAWNRFAMPPSSSSQNQSIWKKARLPASTRPSMSFLPRQKL